MLAIGQDAATAPFLSMNDSDDCRNSTSNLPRGAWKLTPAPACRPAARSGAHERRGGSSLRAPARASARRARASAQRRPTWNFGDDRRGVALGHRRGRLALCLCVGPRGCRGARGRALRRGGRSLAVLADDDRAQLVPRRGVGHELPDQVRRLREACRHQPLHPLCARGEAKEREIRVRGEACSWAQQGGAHSGVAVVLIKARAGHTTAARWGSGTRPSSASRRANLGRPPRPTRRRSRRSPATPPCTRTGRCATRSSASGPTSSRTQVPRWRCERVPAVARRPLRSLPRGAPPAACRAALRLLRRA